MTISDYIFTAVFLHTNHTVKKICIQKKYETYLHITDYIFKILHLLTEEEK